MAKEKVRKVQKVSQVSQVPKARAATRPSTRGLSAQIFDVSGRSQGTMTLPKEVFDQSTKPQLIAQAVRVYFANENKRTAHTKTRGEVRGGGKKPWRQKGTGNARAGSIRSPLWKGGGTTFGPRYHDVKLTLPAKMKKKALYSALSTKAKSGQIRVISNLEKITPKTKVVSTLIKKLNTGPSLFIISQKNPNLKLASRSLSNIAIETANNLNAYKVLKSRSLLFSKEAIAKLT